MLQPFQLYQLRKICRILPQNQSPKHGPNTTSTSLVGRVYCTRAHCFRVKHDPPHSAWLSGGGGQEEVPPNPTALCNANASNPSCCKTRVAGNDGCCRTLASKVISPFSFIFKAAPRFLGSSQNIRTVHIFLILDSVFVKAGLISMLLAPSWRRYLVAVALLTRLSVLCRARDCFYPNGDIDSTSTPCNPMADYSPCCDPGDFCLSNGLCFITAENIVRRQSCMDDAWGEACAQYCMEGRFYFSSI